MQVYELSYLILPSIPEDKLPDVVDTIRGVVTKHGGTEIGAEAPFKQSLSYSMSKTIGASRYVLTDAYLGWIKFDLPALPDGREQAGVEHPVEKIKASLKKIAEILRFLLVKAPRETTFTFAKARSIAEEKGSEPVPSPVEEAVVL